MAKIVTMGMGETIDGISKYWMLEYPFEYNDGGRKNSKRPKQSSDCTVRALAIATNTDYDETYDCLAKAGRKCSKGFNFRKWAKDNAFNGYKFEWMSFPAVKGQKRMNPAQFCEERKKGIYICRTAKHIFAIVDGILYDSWEQNPDRCIYACWKVIKI